MRYGYLTGKKEWHRPFLQESITTHKKFLAGLEALASVPGRTLKDRVKGTEWEKLHWKGLSWSWDTANFEYVRGQIEKELKANLEVLNQRVAA